MDRITIKENAKKMIKGNLWYIWKPMVWFMIACFVIGLVFGILDSICNANGSIASISSYIFSIIGVLYGVAYAYYCLSFVRGQRMEVKDVFNFVKEHWVISLLVSIVVELNVLIGSILLVIPGIIAAMGLALYAYVVADNTELTTSEVLRKSWDITKGYKWDIFIFFLSFIGWLILAPFTLFILYIWLIPYMNIAEVLVYESLKK